MEIRLERISLLLRTQSRKSSSLVFCNLRCYDCLFTAHTNMVLEVYVSINLSHNGAHSSLYMCVPYTRMKMWHFKPF
jgi:hypothetical protein